MSALTHPPADGIVAPSMTSGIWRRLGGKGMLGLCLICVGVGIPAAGIGDMVLKHQQFNAALVRWDLLALEVGAGGALTITGFSLLAACSREGFEIDPAAAEFEAASGDRVCVSCRAANDSDARFCDQCGVRLV